jgi:hypothetical protein
MDPTLLHITVEATLSSAKAQGHRWFRLDVGTLGAMWFIADDGELVVMDLYSWRADRLKQGVLDLGVW